MRVAVIHHRALTGAVLAPAWWGSGGTGWLWLCLRGCRSQLGFGGAVAHAYMETLCPPQSPSVLALPSPPWQCSTSASAMGMSCIHPCPGGVPEPQGCPISSCITGAALLLSPRLCVPRRCPVSITAVRMAHAHLGWGFSHVCPCPHPATPWDCSTSICPIVFHLCLEMPHQIWLLPLNTRGQACALPAASTCPHVLGGSTVPPALGLSGCSVAGGTPVYPVRSTSSVHGGS